MARIIQIIAERGYAANQVATMDTTCSYEQGRHKILWEDTNPGAKRCTYPYLLNDMLPWLKEHRMSDSETHQLVTTNPRRIFEN